MTLAGWAAAIALLPGPAWAAAPTAAVITGSGTGFGSVLGPAGDVDGDGFDDLLAAGPEAIDLGWYEGGPAVPPAPTGVLSPPAAAGWFGPDARGIGDTDGDGLDEIAVGSPQPGAAAAYVYPGGLSGPVDSPTLLDVPDGSAGPCSLGSGDFDGDGHVDLLVGGRSGILSVFAGSAVGLSSVATVLQDPGASGFGRCPAGLGDVDLDGFDDAAALEDGAVAILLGSSGGLLAPTSTLPGADGPPAGIGDADGDGFADLAVHTASGLTIFSGSNLGFDPADAVVLGSDDPDLGASLSAAGDVDGDGLADVVAGDPRWAGSTGLARLFYGNGTSLELPGHGHSRFGETVAGIGDLDADGRDDLAISAPRRAVDDRGTVEVFLAAELPPRPIDAALGDCGGAFDTPPAYPNQLQSGSDLHRMFLSDPAAVCNDGSPAVLYVEAASDPAHTSDWVLHLQGGADCSTEEECADRWCGTNYYDASKMSSRYAPATIRGVGILDIDDPLDSFAGWNHVFFYYCSSDDWQGRSAATLTSADGALSFTLQRRGHEIVRAAFDALEAGATSEDGAVVLPPLAGPGTVLFTGSSAGSIGAQSHLDWVRDRLPAEIAVFGVFDAAIAPDPATLTADLAAAANAGLADRYALYRAQEQRPRFGDASCLAGAAPGDEWTCTVSSRLPYQFVTTPFFARMDLVDPVTMPYYVAVGATEDEFAGAVAASLGELSAFASVFGPHCGIHLGIEVDTQFMDHPVDGWSLHDAIAAAVSGTPVYAVDPDGTLSTCP